ncbi:regulator of microtubule dynamics protein 1-like [Hetaerina americana]|uniref:regulator of microtubule dynamics protein 1-like n=1 Tax=Hetaerina americana TaxID=62018 RepID=UPI003A7F51E8
MNADLLRYRGLLAAAVGAGVVLGAAGVFLYHQLHAERNRRLLMRQELDSLGGTVAEIQRQLESLRGRRGWKKFRQNVNTLAEGDEDDAATIKSEKSLDLFSIYSTEDDEDEYYDFSSDGEEEAIEGPLKDLLEKVDELLTGNTEDKNKALCLLMEKKDEYTDSAGVHWRLAKACHSVGSAEGESGNLEKKKELITQGYEFAKQALELDDSSAEVHKWFAITVGSIGEFIGTKEKIENGVTFKEHVDTALKLHPTDPSLHHLLGRFMYEVATLSWLERKIAGALFAEIPKASFSEAVEEFEEAEKLSKAPWKENRLLLAKALIGSNEFIQAVEWLEKAAEIPIQSPEDIAAEREVKELLIKYQSYRS